MYESLQKLKCVVVQSTDKKHRYNVLIKDDNRAALLVSIVPLQQGEELVALYVCENNGETLLAADLPEIKKRKTRNQTSQPEL
jgi:hypothetical protein